MCLVEVSVQCLPSLRLWIHLLAGNNMRRATHTSYARRGVTSCALMLKVEKSPKPVASCAMPAGPGMKIKTDTPMVKKAREGVMEFLLVSRWGGARMSKYCGHLALHVPWDGAGAQQLMLPLLCCRSTTLWTAPSATREASATCRIR